MPELARPNQVKCSTPMPAIGGLLVAVCFAEIGVAMGVYNFFTDYKRITWWIFICPFIAALFGLISNSRCVVISGLVFCMFSLVTGSLAFAIEGYTYAWSPKSLTGCINQASGGTYGTPSGVYAAEQCLNIWAESPPSPHFCVCGRNTTDHNCFWANLAQGSDCGRILTVYAPLEVADDVLVLLMTLLSLVFAIVASTVACGSSRNFPLEYDQLETAPLTGSDVELTQPSDAGASDFRPVEDVYSPLGDSSMASAASLGAPVAEPTYNA